jgi:hypothetical protein
LDGYGFVSAKRFGGQKTGIRPVRHRLGERGSNGYGKFGLDDGDFVITTSTDFSSDILVVFQIPCRSSPA